MSHGQDPVAQHAGEQDIVAVPIARIHVANPRARSRKVFAGIVDSIASVGLKRPITVVETGADADGPRYDLVCGQGRLEAFLALGETAIPAVVVRAEERERHLMSLVENLARRKHSNRDLLSAVGALEDRGYKPGEIAGKIGVDVSYVHCILALLRGGEERLIGAVEKGWLPITLAAEIARAGEAEVQVAMMQAYESGLLRGDQLMKVRRLIDSRSKLGRNYGLWRRKGEKPVMPNRLAQTFQAEVRRQQLVSRKVDAAEQRLLFVVTAVRQIFADEHFRTLMRAEGVQDVPKPLADRLARRQG